MKIIAHTYTILGNWCEDWHGTRITSRISFAAPHLRYKSTPLVSGIIATFISLNGDRPPLMMTNILRTLCIRQGVIASCIRKLSYFYTVWWVYGHIAANSYTTRALIQGALHVEAKFTLKAQSGTLRLVNAIPDFDPSTIRSILTGSNNGTGKIVKHPIFDVNKLKNDDSAFIKAKLETISIFSRGILSKVEEGADVYKANVSEFDIAEIKCKFNNGVCYDCTIP